MKHLKTDYKNSERFYAEDMNLLTSTINELMDLSDESVKMKFVDNLPEVGEEKTMYFTLPSNGGNPMLSALLYDDGDGVPTLDWMKSTSTQAVRGLEIGDVFKYVKDDSEKQGLSFLGVVETGDTTFHVGSNTQFVEYNIGDTFRVVNPESDSIVFTDVNNPSVTLDGQINGVGSVSVLEDNKVYRLIGYYSATYPQELVPEFPFEIDGIYVMSYEEVYNVSDPDYEVYELPSVQIIGVDRAYIVPSSIDKNNLMCKVGYPDDENYPTCKIESGVTSTITLRDGHYYRLVDRYYLKSNQIGGVKGAYLVASEYGCEIFVFEEVINPDVVKYDNMSFVPGGQLCTNHTYTEDIKFFISVVKHDNPEIPEIEYRQVPEVIDNFPSIEIGEIVKITSENTGYEGDPFVAIESVDGDSLEFREGMILGVTNANVWSENEYYKCTGYYHANYENEEELRGGKFYVPTFEKVTGSTAYDYTVNTVPCLCFSKEKSPSTRVVWMWIDNDWALIGSVTGDMFMCATKEVIIPDGGSAQSVTISSNTLYTFTTRTSDLTLSLGTPTGGIVNEYHFIITIGSTTPTINWPNNLSWYGNDGEPSISANKTYEVSILNNIAVYIEI